MYIFVHSNHFDLLIHALGYYLFIIYNLLVTPAIITFVNSQFFFCFNRIDKEKLIKRITYFTWYFIWRKHRYKCVPLKRYEIAKKNRELICRKCYTGWQVTRQRSLNLITNAWTIKQKEIPSEGIGWIFFLKLT